MNNLGHDPSFSIQSQNWLFAARRGGILMLSLRILHLSPILEAEILLRIDTSLFGM